MLYKYDSNTLQYKEVSLKQYVYGFLILAVLFTSVGFTTAVKFNNAVEKIAVVIRVNEQEFSEENLRTQIRKLNLKFEDVIVAQYKIETGNGTSKIFKENNNLFGMKKAVLRPNTALGEQYEHAYYENWIQSLMDYGYWQAYNAKNIRNQQEYLQLLSEIYAEDKSYINKLQYYLK